MTTQTAERSVTETRPMVFLDGVLLSTKIMFWRGKEVLQPQDLGFDGGELPEEIFSLGRKLIVPKAAIQAFMQIEERVRWVTDRFSFPFPTGHAKFVPYAVLPEVLAELQKQQDRFQTEMTVFTDGYAAYRQEILTKYPKWERALQSKYESPASLMSKFSFTWSVFEIRLPEGLRVRAMDDKMALTEAKARREALEVAETQLKKQFQEQIDGFLGDSVKELRSRVAGSVAKIQEQLTAGKVNPQTLKGIRNSIESFRNLNFVGDEAVESQLNSLLALLPDKVDAFDNVAFTATFTAAAGAVMDTVKSEDVSAVTGEYKRRIKAVVPPSAG